MKKMTDEEKKRIMEERHKADIEGLLMVYPPKAMNEKEGNADDVQGHSDDGREATDSMVYSG